jgi:tRNA threonylcarbamoyladenosine biosynthesis protein TsaB
MKSLALDTSSDLFSLALFEDGAVAASFEESAPMRQSERLLPALQDLLKQAGWTVKDLKAVALSAGPGSFTGLRGGLAFCQGLALGQEAKVVGVSSLQVLAAASALPDAPQTTAVFLDARRGQVYFAIYGLAPEFKESRAPELMELEKAIALAPWPCRVAGDGPRKHPGAFEPLQQDGDFALGLTVPLAQAAGQLAWQRMARGEFDDIEKLEPFYLRNTAAEMKKAAPPA